jgi:hypothetical protein
MSVAALVAGNLILGAAGMRENASLDSTLTKSSEERNAHRIFQ